ncbi:MAG TPA: hypothetical protein VJ850_05750 [Candidatus Limnocylindrales bacterium]|nr:hypothetical protein [Candidatus Limnocylindrales bacterium]
MKLEDLLGQVLAALEAEAIPYMVTGSVASSRYGEPRSTNDADVVVDPSREQLEAFVQRIQADGLYVDLEAARAAVTQRAQFNVAALDLKVDLIVRKSDAFSTSAFGRRRRVRGPALDADVISPEDLILSKLVWAIETGSERQLRDVEGIAAIAEGLDRRYIETWAARLNLAEAWKRIDDLDS